MFDLNTNLLSILILNRKNLSVMFHKNDVEMRKKNILMIIEIVTKRIYFLQTTNIAFLIIEEKSKISKKSKTISNQQSMGAILILAFFFQKKTLFRKNAQIIEKSINQQKLIQKNQNFFSNGQ